MDEAGPRPALVSALTAACCALGLLPVLLYFLDVPTLMWGRVIFGPALLVCLVLACIDRLPLALMRSGESAATMLAPVVFCAVAVIAHDWVWSRLDGRAFLAVWCLVSVLGIWLAARSFVVRPSACGALLLLVATCLLAKLTGNAVDAHGFGGMFYSVVP